MLQGPLESRLRLVHEAAGLWLCDAAEHAGARGSNSEREAGDHPAAADTGGRRPHRAAAAQLARLACTIGSASQAAPPGAACFAARPVWAATCGNPLLAGSSAAPAHRREK